MNTSEAIQATAGVILAIAIVCLIIAGGTWGLLKRRGSLLLVAGVIFLGLNAAIMFIISFWMQVH